MKIDFNSKNLERGITMPIEFSPLKLRKNTVYPSYQLYATAGSSKLSVKETFKVCILETLYWIRQKFENFEIPEELKSPDPDMYKSFDLDDLKNFRIEHGYVVDSVYVKSKNIWSFQLVEPHLMKTIRTSVPGRVFTTDISFMIEENTVKCAFRTLVSDPERCRRKILSLRNGVIKRLVRNPNIDLFHNSLLINEKSSALSSESIIKYFINSLNDPKRTLPMIVFAEYKKETENTNEKKNSETDKKELKNISAVNHESLLHNYLPLKSASPFNFSNIKVKMNFDDKVQNKLKPITDDAKKKKDMASKKEEKSKKAEEKETENEIEEEPAVYLYSPDDMAFDFMGYAFVFALPYNKIKVFSDLTNEKILPGEAVVFEPEQYGDKLRFKYFENIENNHSSLVSLMNTYHLKKYVDFSDHIFVRDARIVQQKEILKKCSSMDELITARVVLTKELEVMKNSVDELARCKSKLIQFEEKVDTAKNTINKLKHQIAEQNLLLEQEKNNTSQKEKRLQIQVDYYQSLEERPKQPKDIPAWIRQRFSDSIVLHKKAADMLEKLDNSSSGYLKKLCDSLEYLATEYYQSYYSKEISKEEASLYAALKYKQEFQVKLSGEISVAHLPEYYKVKYDKNDGSRRKEYPLNIHLKSGTDTEHLIRIYFFYDEVNRKIVIGSLPKHLPTVSDF